MKRQTKGRKMRFSSNSKKVEVGLKTLPDTPLASLDRESYV